MTDDSSREKQPQASASEGEIPEAVVVKKERLSAAWIIPIIALIAAGWLVYQTLSVRGPVITIEMDDATGLEPGKSGVKHHGVDVGTVIGIGFNETLSKVLVKVRLIREAEALAAEGSSFWVVKPTISLGNVSGLETIVSGVYIASSIGGGAPKYDFVALKSAPIIPLNDPGLSLQLIASTSEGVNPGSPVYYRRVPVGKVEKLFLSEDMSNVVMRVYIKTNYTSLINASTKFFRMPRISASAGPGLFNVQIDSLKEFIEGGITFENFDTVHGTEPAKDLDKFRLFDSLVLARNSGIEVELILDNASGIGPQRTFIKHQGMNVGIIETVDFDGGLQRVKARATLRPEAESLVRDGARYWVVRPKIGWEGVSGADTAFSGIYLEAFPGNGAVKTSFKVTDWSLVDEITTEHPDGLLVRLHSSSVKINEGAPVYYKSFPVGRIVGIGLNANATRAELKALIFNQYKHLVRENSVFWNAGGIQANFGFLGMGASLDVAPLQALLAGGVAFATPEQGGRLAPAAKPGRTFDIADKPQEDWLRWSPAIPVK